MLGLPARDMPTDPVAEGATRVTERVDVKNAPIDVPNQDGLVLGRAGPICVCSIGTSGRVVWV